MARARSKYGNVKTTVAGEKFDSKREAMRWVVLKQMARDGEISNLERQATYVLAQSVKIAGEGRRRPAMRFKADFRYTDRSGATIVEDSKGCVDTAFRIRQHLMKSVHNIDVRLS